MHVSVASAALSGGAEALTSAKPGARPGGTGNGAKRFRDALEDIAGKALNGAPRTRNRERIEPARTDSPGRAEAAAGKGIDAKAGSVPDIAVSPERISKATDPKATDPKPQLEPAKAPDADHDGSALAGFVPTARAKPETFALRVDLSTGASGSAQASALGQAAFVNADTTPKTGAETRRTTPGQQRREAGPVHGTDHRKGAEAANTVPEGKPEPIKADNAMPVPSHPMQPQAKTPEVALAAPQPQQPPQQAASGGDGRASEGTAGPASAGYKPADMPAPAALAPLVSIRVLPKGEGSNSKALEIRLDPPELGRVDVKLETAQDGTLKAVLSAERVEALELLRRDQGTLENALRQAGVALGDNAISFSLSAGAGEQDPGGGRHERPDGARAFGEAAQVQDAAMQAAWTAWRDGVLDMKV